MSDEAEVAAIHNADQRLMEVRAQHCELDLPIAACSDLRTMIQNSSGMMGALMKKIITLAVAALVSTGCGTADAQNAVYLRCEGESRIPDESSGGPAIKFYKIDYRKPSISTYVGGIEINHMGNADFNDRFLSVEKDMIDGIEGDYSHLIQIDRYDATVFEDSYTAEVSVIFQGICKVVSGPPVQQF